MNIIKKFLIITSLCFVSLPSIASEWKKSIYEKEEMFPLPYQLFIPDDTTSKLPLVIYLHGYGEGGTDNLVQIYPGAAMGASWFSAKPQDIQQAYILAPQTVSDIGWGKDEGSWEKDYIMGSIEKRENPPLTQPMESLFALIDEVAATYPIDHTRIYIVGISMGGQGVWNAVLHRPDFFAAAIPICGYGDYVQFADRLTSLPIWAFHGNRDNIVDVQTTRAMVNAIHQAGGSSALLRYTEVEGGGHIDAWTYAHKDLSMWHWLLQHQKIN